MVALGRLGVVPALGAELSDLVLRGVRYLAHLPLRTRFPVLGASAVFALAGVLAVVLSSGAAAAGTTNDGCGYPASSFTESTVIRWAQINGQGSSAQLVAFANDEKGLLLGVNGATTMASATANGSNGQTGATSYHSGPYSQPGPSNPQGGSTTEQDASGRVFYPALYITNLTAHPLTGGTGAGDFQNGGTPRNISASGQPFVDEIFGSWSTATKTGSTYTVTPPPAQNNWNLGTGSDTPVGTTFSAMGNEGYGAEVRWNVNELKDSDGNALVPGNQYRFQVIEHDGDQNKTGGDSGEFCVSLQIPGVTTSLAKKSISVDGSTNDSARLSKVTSNAGGTVDYRYYATQAACQTDASAFPGTAPTGGTDVGSVNVSSGSVPDSASATFHNAGTYYWAAFYSGDASNAPAVSDCSSEQLVVNQAAPSISTSLGSNPIAVDGSTKDSATLSNASGNAGGTVDYRYYSSQADCQTDASAFPGTAPTGGTDVGSVTVSSGSVPDSASATFHNAGTYYWAAFYSGDANNQAAVSDCSSEQLTVNQAAPSISTSLGNNPIAVDGSTTDSATLSNASGNAGGTVDYRYYSSQADCQNDASAFPGTAPTGGTDVGSVKVSSGSVPDSASATFHNAGTYYWAAFYSGDANNQAAVSDCSSEQLMVNQAAPSISTALASNPIPADASTTDSASLSGASGNAGGTVDYRYYSSQADCQNDASAFPGTAPTGGTDVGSVNVSSGSVPDSASATFHNAGTYYWAAFYSGDANNQAAVSDCSSEQLVVNQAGPSIFTSLKTNPIGVDGATKDSATLSNTSGNAGGTVDYRYYSTQAACQSDATAFPKTAPSGGTDVGTVTVTGGSVPDSASATFHNAGTYYWAAFYSGDTNNNPAVSGCGTERLTVNHAGPSIATSLKSNPIPVDGSTTDSAALSNASQNAGGTVDYRYYSSQAACQTDASAFPKTAPSGGTDVGTVTMTGGSVPDSASATFHNAGTYYWAAFYSGDANNQAAVSDCSSEQLTVNQAAPSIDTSLKSNPIAADGSTTDSATLSNASGNAGGTVDYRYYSSQVACQNDAIAFPGTAPSGGTDVGTVTVTGASVPDSASATFHNAGTYYWAAFYSGDSSNQAAVSDCSSEQLTVNPPLIPGISTVKLASVRCADLGVGVSQPSGILPCTGIWTKYTPDVLTVEIPHSGGYSIPIRYLIQVTNTGNTPLSLSLSDPLCDAGTISGPVKLSGTLTGHTLSAGGRASYTCMHTLTQNDPDTSASGQPFTNTATVTGNPPSGPPVHGHGKVTVHRQVKPLAKKICRSFKTGKPITYTGHKKPKACKPGKPHKPNGFTG
jgi:hypothetical protein